MALKQNEMEITILEDGTVKIETGSVAGPVHLTAERFLAWVADQMGGEAHREKLGHTHAHEHEHEHEHVHAGMGWHKH